MNIFSIESYIFQQIIYSLKTANNMFTQFYIRNLWRNIVIKQPYMKRPLACLWFWKERREVLKNTKRTNRLFLFYVNTVISAAQDRWPVNVHSECIYRHLYKASPEKERLSKKDFDKVLREKEKDYQRSVVAFFEEVKARFLYTFPKGQRSLRLRKIFFNAALSFLQDPKLQKEAIKKAKRKSKVQYIANHKITDIRKAFYDLEKRDRKAGIPIFKSVA